MTKIIDQLMESQVWIMVEVRMKISSFTKQFNSSVSNFYRTLSNSPRMFMNTTYRSFFKKNFCEGFYRSSILQNDVSVIFFLKSTENLPLDKLTRELTLRIKKLVLVPVVISHPNCMSETDKQLLTSREGLKNYQKILSTYQKGRI
jgi:hypothetical protein